MAGLDLAEMALGVMGEALQGVSMTVQFRGSLEDYGARQVFDVGWATDWDAGDEWYSVSTAAAHASRRSTGALAGPAMAGFPAWMDWGLDRAWHGRDWHNAMSRAYAEYYSAKYGPQNVRFTQTLVNAQGKMVSRMRPNVQVHAGD